MEISKKDKAVLFVAHIEQHLKEIFPNDPNVKVICKICGKTIDDIANEVIEMAEKYGVKIK